MLIGKLRFGQFLVAAVGQNAHPLRRAGDFVNLETNLGIGAHPFDLLSERGKDIEVTRFVRQVDRHYIGLIIERTSQPTDCGARQNVASHKTATSRNK